jgi:2,3-bisphosphoglycerate-dependent phosphoglycerate mutase
MRKILFVAALLLLVTTSFSQDQKITTLILLRHAEKISDGSSDPDLTQEGIDRAFRLATLLKNANVAAIYSTDFKRTRNTVAMLARDKGLEVQIYAPSKGAELDKMISQHEGKTIVVVGHSNTIPGIANILIGKNEFENFPDAEYGNILVIPITAKGKAGDVIRLTY